jgi:acetyltransferase-like isoleucine patch superfamily enzyme
MITYAYLDYVSGDTNRSLIVQPCTTRTLSHVIGDNQGLALNIRYPFRWKAVLLFVRRTADRLNSSPGNASSVWRSKNMSNGEGAEVGRGSVVSPHLHKGSDPCQLSSGFCCRWSYVGGRCIRCFYNPRSCIRPALFRFKEKRDRILTLT